MDHGASGVMIDPLRTTAELSFGQMIQTREIRLGGWGRGAVLLLCAAGELDEASPERMNRLALHGFETLAVDLTPLGLDDHRWQSAVAELLEILGARGWEQEQIGVVGYADGGRAALVAASEFVLGAAISLSPSRINNVASRVKTPWLGMFGEYDGTTSPQDITTLRQKLAGSPQFTQLVVYPGVNDKYFREFGNGRGYAAAFDSWQRVVEWLSTRVAPRPSPNARI